MRFVSAQDGLYIPGVMFSILTLSVTAFGLTVYL